MLDLYLASTSPRRRELLTRAGIRFRLWEPGPEYLAGEVGEPAALALARARRKARLAPAPPGDAPVLGVDTVVDLDGRELGKPDDRDEARAMLLALAGKNHRVHTAHSLAWGAGASGVDEVASAVVQCRAPTDAELRAYLDGGEWRGKAGGYGIQDETQAFLTLVEGSFDTVVGLHVEAVVRLLALMGAK